MTSIIQKIINQISLNQSSLPSWLSLECKFATLDHVEFHGEPSECSGVVVQGHMILTTKVPIKISKISMNFEGFMSTYISQNGLPHNGYKQLISQSWNFFENDQDPSLKVPEGQYSYPFELVLPGDLPASLEISDACVRYEFNIDLKLSKGHRYNRTIPYMIKRLTSPSSQLAFESVYFTGVWNDVLDYTITSSHKALIPNRPTSVHVDMRSLAPLKSCQFAKIAFCIQQRTTLTASKGRQVVKEEDLNKIEYKVPKHQLTKIQSTVTIPLEADTLCPTTNNELIKTKHWLVVSLCLYLNNQPRMISLKIPITVLDPANADRILQGGEEELPMYSGFQLEDGSVTLQRDSLPPSYEDVPSIPPPSFSQVISAN